MVCFESIHTLTDIYRSCTDAARQMHVLFRVVGSLLLRSELASQGTSRSLITQCHSLPLLVGRARQDTAPNSDEQPRNCPFSYDTNHSCCVIEEFVPFNSSFFFSLKLPFPHRQVYPSQACPGSPMCLSTFSLWKKKSPWNSTLQKGRDLAVPFKTYTLI